MSLSVLKVHQLSKERDRPIEFKEIVFIDGVNSSRCVQENDQDVITIPHQFISLRVNNLTEGWYFIMHSSDWRAGVHQERQVSIHVYNHDVEFSASSNIKLLRTDVNNSR